MATVDLGSYHSRALFRSCSSACGRAVGGAERSVRDAETRPPGAPGVRWDWGIGQGRVRPGHNLCSHFAVPGRRQAEPEQNDGEEDFYYTELYVGMDKLTNRLSSLTPVSPTVSMPPTFPHVEFSELLEPPVLPNLPHPLTLFPSPKLSSSAVPQVCHSDQAYQQGEATDEDGGRSQSTLERNRTGVVTPSRDAWLPTTWSHSPLRPKPTYQPCLLSLGSSWKPWGDSKKCWKVYGVDHRDLCIQPAAGRKSASSSWTEPIP
ncbi:SLC2A4 regulator [Peromyscus leucopus]|uniref:SLC2A4 regulator n=1 Tax=Peromyscus leucopus TaxID=10041 RepID=UPI0010A12C54|nr:SLC2A4 regulator [Peromyscus leucopus]